VRLARPAALTFDGALTGARLFPKIATRLVLWRLLLSPPLDGPDNMALDEALMARARRTGETVLRAYAWSAPTLSLGRNQRARGQYDERALHGRGIGVVRRPTGGRALLHARELTYSVTAPVRADQGLAAAYAAINLLLVDALAALGVPAGVAVAGARTARASAPTTLPCFAEPAVGELSYGGRKLAGSAQWRDDGAFLQHGSILVDDDQATLGALTLDRIAAAPPPATLRAILGRAPSAREMLDALAGAVASRHAAMPTVLELDARLEDETRRDARALADRYRDPAWTWRR
jgi:lipoate-protein ligase A